MYPGGAPTNRETVCFSWYSDISMRTIARSSSKRYAGDIFLVHFFLDELGRALFLRQAFLLGLQLLFQLGELAVLQLRRLVQIVGAFRLLDLQLGLVDLLAKVA